MRGLAKLVLGLLGLGAIACFLYLYRVKMGLSGSGRTLDNDTTSQSSSSPAPAQIDWQNVDRSPDGFEVQMPAGTNQTLIPAYNARGGVEEVNMIMAMPGSDTFAVAWADHPPVERAAKMLKRRWTWHGTAPSRAPKRSLPGNRAAGSMAIRSVNFRRETTRAAF